MEYIRQNIDIINEKIAEAADKSGRNFSDITLVAVTKTVSAEKINFSIDCGIKNIGENKAQEFLSKLPHVKRANYHFIGSLQTNKVKTLIGKTVLIQSVDSLALARKISDESLKQGVVSDVLLEINIAGEYTKHGFSPDTAFEDFASTALLAGLRPRGFMTVAPYVECSEKNRDFFKKMFNIFVDTKNKLSNNISTNCMLDVLSMGMTGDFTTAVEEGATMVRIGAGIYGERNVSTSTNGG